jgi:hypothetical protein
VVERHEGKAVSVTTFDERGLVHPKPLSDEPEPEAVEPAEVIEEPPAVVVLDDDDLVYDPS